MNIPIVDADGHVTETSEQVAKYLDEPYRRRPLGLPLYPRTAGTGVCSARSAAWAAPPSSG